MSSYASHGQTQKKLTIDVGSSEIVDSSFVINKKIYTRRHVNVIDSSIFSDDNMIDVKCIGSGSGGRVFLKRYTKTGQLYAVKRISLLLKEKRDQLEKELSVLQLIESDSLVQFYGSYVSNYDAFIVLEYMDRGSLQDILQDKVGLAENVVAAIIYQLLLGLQILKQHNIIHRDVKPGNILLNSRGEVKLTDFGISRGLEDRSLAVTNIGTAYYMSPERVNVKGYNSKAEIWSVGIILLECLRGKFPFPAIYNPLDYQILVESDLTPYYKDTNEEIYELLTYCFTKDAHRRPPAETLIGASWFSKMNIHNKVDCKRIMKNYLDSHR
ncbi:hypothetical protein WA158_002530 [Blastocystis sp. Blastoise]